MSPEARLKETMKRISERVDTWKKEEQLKIFALQKMREINSEFDKEK